MTLSGHFVPRAPGALFVLVHRPHAASRDCVLVIPPFAEEMNKCRRTVTLIAAELAARGIATVIPDLYGTGDSTGDFAEATWSGWRSDLGAVHAWLGQQGLQIKGLLATRLGAALARDAVQARELPSPQFTVLCQPVFDGGRYLRQFLRLRVAAAAMADGTKETVEGLRKRFDAGESLDVAGYTLSPQLATELNALRAPTSLADLGAVQWIEIVRDTTAPPASMSAVEALRSAGAHIDVLLCAGEPFWTSTEIVVIPDVVTGIGRFVDSIGRERAA